MYIDFQGKLVSQHVPDKHFDFNSFVTYLNATKGLKWKDIFWKIWSLLYVFNCSECR